MNPPSVAEEDSLVTRSGKQIPSGNPARQAAWAEISARQDKTGKKAAVQLMQEEAAAQLKQRQTDAEKYFQAQSDIRLAQVKENRRRRSQLQHLQTPTVSELKRLSAELDEAMSMQRTPPEEATAQKAPPPAAREEIPEDSSEPQLTSPAQSGGSGGSGGSATTSATGGAGDAATSKNVGKASKKAISPEAAATEIARLRAENHAAKHAAMTATDALNNYTSGQDMRARNDRRAWRDEMRAMEERLKEAKANEAYEKRRAEAAIAYANNAEEEEEVYEDSHEDFDGHQDQLGGGSTQQEEAEVHGNQQAQEHANMRRMQADDHPPLGHNFRPFQRPQWGRGGAQGGPADDDPQRRGRQEDVAGQGRDGRRDNSQDGGRGGDQDSDHGDDRGGDDRDDDRDADRGRGRGGAGGGPQGGPFRRGGGRGGGRGGDRGGRRGERDPMQALFDRDFPPIQQDPPQAANARDDAMIHAMEAIATRVSQPEAARGQPENKLARLDTIKVNVYKGGVLEWYNWRQQFQSVVVDGRNYSEAILYTYLREWTGEQALTAILPVANNQNAYSDAMALLEGQFRDDDTAHAEHIRAMTCMTACKKGDVRTQRNFLNSLQTIIAGLKALDNDPDRPELAKQHMTVISRKLPESDLVDWLRYVKIAPQFNTPTQFHEWYLGTVKVRETAALGKQSQVNNSAQKGSATSFLAGEETLFSQSKPPQGGRGQQAGRGGADRSRGQAQTYGSPRGRGRGRGGKSDQGPNPGPGRGRGRGGGRGGQGGQGGQGGRGGGAAKSPKAAKTGKTKAIDYDKQPQAKKFDPCGFCAEDHNPASCQVGKKASIPERHSLLIKHEGCRRCLRIGGHMAKDCTVEAGCKTCKGPHHTMLHRGKPKTED